MPWVVSVSNRHGRESMVKCSFRLTTRRDQQRGFAEMSPTTGLASRSVETTALEQIQSWTKSGHESVKDV